MTTPGSRDPFEGPSTPPTVVFPAAGGPQDQRQGPPQGPPSGPSQGPPSGPPHGPASGPPQGPPPGPPQGPPPGQPQMPPGALAGRAPLGGPPAPGPQGRHPNPQQAPPLGPPHGFGPSSQVGRPRTQGANAIWVLGLLSLVAVIVGLSVPEDDKSAWDTVHAWGALPILGALLTLATVAATNLGAERAWQVAASGAGALVLFWVLFVLPTVGSNTSLVTTVGVALGVIAVWIAPGRDAVVPPAEREHRW